MFMSFMRLLAYVYAILGLLFYLFHAELEILLRFEPAPDRFWVALSVSMMAMLSYISWQSSRTPDDPRWIQLHLVSKAVSTAGFLFACVLQAPLPGYLVSAAVDASVFAAVWLSYRNYRSLRA